MGGRNDTHYFIITQSVYKIKRINCWYDQELLTYLSNMLGTIKRMEELNENKNKIDSKKKVLDLMSLLHIKNRISNFYLMIIFNMFFVK